MNEVEKSEENVKSQLLDSDIIGGEEKKIGNDKNEEILGKENIENAKLFSSDLIQSESEYRSVLITLDHFLSNKIQNGKIRRMNLDIHYVLPERFLKKVYKTPSEIHLEMEKMNLSKTLIIFRGILCDLSEVLILCYHHKRINYNMDLTYDFGANYGSQEFDFYIVIRENRFIVMKCDDSGHGLFLDRKNRIHVQGKRPSVSISKFHDSSCFFWVCDGEDFKCENIKERELFLGDMSWMKERYHEKQNVSISNMEVFFVF